MASKANTSCKEAIQNYEAKSGKKASEEEHVSLIAQLPPISKMDNSLNSLVRCQKLSLSTNAITAITSLSSLTNLRILSLGRNNIKKIEKLDDIANSLEELWISYNQIEKLDGLSSCRKLRVLYISNNRIKSFDEVSKLKDNLALTDVLFTGNPIYEGDNETCRLNVIRNLPQAATSETFKLDGELIKFAEQQKALASA